MQHWGQAGHEGAAAYGALTPWRGVLRHLLPLALMVLFVLALREKAAALDLAAIGTALAAVSPLQWLGAVAATAISFAALAQYDVLIHRQLATALPEAQIRRAGAAAIAVSQTLGFGLVTGALVRWRMLPGTNLGQATRITALVALAFLAGWAVVTAAVVAVLPVALPGARWMALAVLAGFGALAALAFWRPQRFPPLTLAARIVALAALDTAAASLALWVLLPGGVEAGAALLPAFLLALGAGLISGTPGGVGAFELALLSLLPGQPAEPLLAAVLAWRAVYYALPAALGVLAMARPSRASAPRGLPQLRRGLPVPEAPRAEIGLLAQGEHALLLAPDGTPGWLLAETGQTVTALLDPLAPESLGGLLAEVRAQAAQRGRLACLYKITAPTALRVRAAGWTVLPVAQEAVIDTARFALANPAHAGLRRKLRHAAKAGVMVTSVPPGGALPVAQMAALSAAWVTTRGGERGFSMGRYTPAYVAGQHCVLAWQAGRLVAFASFHTTRGEWTLDLMRSGGGLPDGTMQALMAEAIARAAEAGVPRLSLAAVPPDPAQLRGLPALIWRMAARPPCGLAQFKAGFAPRWQTLYIAAPSPLGLALAAADIARAIRHPRPLPGAQYGFATTRPAWQRSASPSPERLPR
ncbi:phosphatidylglycerol lysyltransferase domain-containing protein [Frigidibacter sp.]|uniref:phosphatidylglycerol lysyltransferase domain-containing protein n=1 Tax=Frigidibacter sp. TaxID=2586418 RepID=UPI0027341232|nr:phosphatidylglycerol lysyltransferase domain-containing protein [Frigidibacter sp.]MDP3339829.1 phosphatidylglycerol lysyltransferase domain-containing protein [Frigidibacter sp.]